MEEDQIVKFVVKDKDDETMDTFDEQIQAEIFERGWQARGRVPQRLTIVRRTYALADETVIQEGGSTSE